MSIKSCPGMGIVDISLPHIFLLGLKFYIMLYTLVPFFY